MKLPDVFAVVSRLGLLKHHQVGRGGGGGGGTLRIGGVGGEVGGGFLGFFPGGVGL